MLGHVLHGSEDGLTFHSLKFAANTLDLPALGLPREEGHPSPTCSHSLIHRDLDEHNPFLRNSDELFALRDIAKSKAK